MEENGGQLPDDHPHQRNMKDSAPLFNLRLIDVLNDEVIQSRGEEKYFALSYVWGTTTQYKALSKNFHKSLVEEHEIGRLSVLRLDRSVLSQTIQDAMCLVQNIGERYLWVDVLCIIQDDPNEVTSTLRFMNKIYSDATMTIVAA
ncbi:heterokaryon incompatibility protein-domain-containing protein, partial [Leptodontidium sp. 2 PMI_412]